MTAGEDHPELVVVPGVLAVDLVLVLVRVRVLVLVLVLVPVPVLVLVLVLVVGSCLPLCARTGHADRTSRSGIVVK